MGAVPLCSSQHLAWYTIHTPRMQRDMHTSMYLMCTHPDVHGYPCTSVSTHPTECYTETYVHTYNLKLPVTCDMHSSQTQVNVLCVHVQYKCMNASYGAFISRIHAQITCAPHKWTPMLYKQQSCMNGHAAAREDRLTNMHIRT